MLMNKAVIVIRPRLMSPCVCRYCLVSGAGVSHITQLKRSALGPSTLLFFIRIISPALSSSTPQPPLRPTHPLPNEMHFLTPVLGWLAEHGEQRDRDDHSFFPPSGALFSSSHTDTQTRESPEMRCNLQLHDEVPLKFSCEHVQRFTQNPCDKRVLPSSCKKASWSFVALGW